MNLLNRLGLVLGLFWVVSCVASNNANFNKFLQESNVDFYKVCNAALLSESAEHFRNFVNNPKKCENFGSFVHKDKQGKTVVDYLNESTTVKDSDAKIKIIHQLLQNHTRRDKFGKTGAQYRRLQDPEYVKSFVLAKYANARTEEERERCRLALSGIQSTISQGIAQEVAQSNYAYTMPPVSLPAAVVGQKRPYSPMSFVENLNLNSENNDDFENGLSLFLPENSPKKALQLPASGASSPNENSPHNRRKLESRPQTPVQQKKLKQQSSSEISPLAAKDMGYFGNALFNTSTHNTPVKPGDKECHIS